MWATNSTHGSSGNYRYGFNGKENDNEIFGEGNSIDFGARMLDSRIGRWLSVDPLAEKFPSHSPYSFVFNNPLRFIDPDGRAPFDHIFDARGNFIRDTGVGNAVKIQIGGKLYNPSQLDNSRGSRHAISKIGAYYAGKVGTDVGTMITTGKGDQDSDKNPASTRGQVISLNTNGGFSKALDEIPSFKSVMRHENNHKEDNEKSGFTSTLSTHADVYINQMKDAEFSSTSSGFQIGTAASFGNYLLNMDRKDFGQNAILSKMNSFNKSNTGGFQIQRQGDNFGNFAPGTLSLELQYKGNTYPINYEKVDE